MKWLCYVRHRWMYLLKDNGRRRWCYRCDRYQTRMGYRDGFDWVDE